MGKRTPALCLFVAVLWIVPWSISSHGAREAPWIAAHAEAAFLAGPEDGIILASPDGEVLYSENAERMLVPASILKILTALVAFEHLGPDYRFPTDFFTDPDGNLIIRGYGDPLLVSETVAEIAGRLSESIGTVNDLVIDGSLFDEVVIPGTGASLRAFDAPVGALCVNFNTVYFRTENERLQSAEPQTPLLPMAKKRIRGADAGDGRILLSPDARDAARYAGELFSYFLLENGVRINGEVRLGRKDDAAGLTLIHRHRQDTDVTGLVRLMMAHSNNFIANQLLLAAGAKAYGAPATLDKGVKAARAYAGSLGIDPDIVEGSGISRANRLSAEMMLPVLEAFAPHYDLLQRRGDVYFKTGTLSGIQTRAGYIRKESGGGNGGALYPFAVLINTWGKPADPVVDRLAARPETR